MISQYEKFRMRKAESFDEYKIRCYKEKQTSNISWKVLASIINDYTDTPHSESYYRKECRKLIQSGILTQEEKSIKEDLQEIVQKIKKERYKLQEERTQNNAYVRKLAREETLKDIAKDFADKMSSKKLLEVHNSWNTNEEKEAILMISDWHYGIEVNNYFNVYNPDICRERVSKLLNEVIDIGTENKIRKIHVVNLSDLIAGRIHLTIRLESREDVISQVMTVSEILAEFLTELSKYFEVCYSDVMDNHSRLEPSKKDSIELETLVRIIPWYLKERLSKNKCIKFIENSYADDITAFKVFDFNVVGVHGHKDKPNKVIENLSAMTRRRNDLVLSAHYHHMSLDESHECLRISNGSLMGVDTFAQDLRLTNKPSQTMIICTPDNVAKAIYKVNLDS